MPYENEEQVLEALREAAQQDGFDSSPEGRIAAEATRPTQPDEQAATPAPEAERQSEEQPSEDSFTHIDPASLPGDLQDIYKSMQGDYTRSKQRIAEYARRYEALEEYGGPEVAAEAVEWVASLQNPDNALTLHRELTQALTDRGYSLGEAQAAATQQVAEAQRAEQEDEFSLDPEPDPRVDQLQRELGEMKAWRDQREKEEFNLRLAAHYDRQEAEILTGKQFQTEEEKDTYLEDVYNLSFAFGGDLTKADEYLQDQQSRFLASYLSSKTAVPSGSTIPTTGPADVPTGFTDLNDPQLERAVNRFLAEQSAADS